MNPINHTGKTRKGFLLTAGFLLLMLPLVLITVQQQQDSRQRASELSFKTLPPGSPLPSDEECTIRVRRAVWEPRPGNVTANNANVYIQGYRLNGSELAQYGPGYEDKVTGNFTGTTDEIIQWAACKWGFDENTVRAQASAESSWQQMLLGKCLGGQVQPDTNSCHSVGIMQVTSANIPPSHPGTWPYARISTAFNIDYTLAIRRACFEGKLRLPGVGYQAGDEWGCIGQWNTGAWHNPKAETYIAKVKKALANSVWNTYGAGPLPTFPLISQAVPSLSPAPSTTVPTVQLSPTSPYVVPTFFCLAAPCPITPSVEPSVSAPPQPTVAPTAVPTTFITLAPSEEPSAEPSEPEPTAVQPSDEVTISPFPTEDPCAPTTSVAHSKHKSKHKDHNGGISNFMEMLLKFFMELINLLMKLIGNNENPNPVPSPSITPIISEDPLDPVPSEDEEEFPTVDPCAPTEAPEPEPSIEQPLPSEPEVSVPVNPTSNVTPGTPSTPITSTFPSGTTLPSQSTSPGAVSPTEDPCAPVASVAHSKKKKSKHKGHNGFITKFMRFIIEFFIRIFKMIGQTPTNPSPVPSPVPTLSDPGITNEPILTLEPSEEPGASAEPSAPAIVSGDPTAEPTPCGGADTSVISGKVTTDSRYFTTLNIGVADTETLGQVRTHTVNDPYANRDYTYTFTNLHPDKTYLVSVSACRTINTQQVCSKPMEILNCSGAIDEQEIACKITGSGTADFAVKRALLPSGSPAPTTGVIPSSSPAPTGISGATPTVFFNLQRGR